MENRNYIIDRLKSKTVSIDEFNYDRLQAPPISAMFTPFDIMQLNKIAKSIKYSGRPDLKYQEIDKIMRSRGFVKFIAGTNRVVYRPVENNTFLVKVAADAVGLGDNPREYRNQFLFKPFVTKVFEITPCGTLGVFERVVPITSREEFLSVAPDIFEVINSWFVGEYVLEDIGTRFFMNWGIRVGFGPVLLDFPYVYKLDGNKLFCNAPANNTKSGCCEGVIDYDPGYNFLYCTKCGVKYKAKELAEAIKEQKIISKSTEGEVKMKIKVTGGTKNVNNVIVTGDYAGMAKCIPSSTEKKKESVKTGSGLKVKMIKPVEYEEKKDESVKEEVATTKEEREVVSPIEFDPSLIKQDKVDIQKAEPIHEGEPDCNRSDKENDESDIEKFNRYLSLALYTLETSSDEDREVMISSFKEGFKEYIREATEAEDEDKSVEEIADNYTKYDLNTIAYFLTDNVDRQYDKDREFDLSKEYFSDFIKALPENITSNLLSALLSERYIIKVYCNGIEYSEDEESGNGYISLEMIPGFGYRDDEDEDDSLVDEFEKDTINFGIRPTDLILSMKNAGYNVTEINNEEEISSDEVIYGGIKYCAAKVVNIKDIMADQENGKVIVIINEQGNYASESNKIIAIDTIDDKSVDNLAIVSSSWLDNVVVKAATSSVSPEYYDDIESVNASNTTVGAQISVNGVPTEE